MAIDIHLVNLSATFTNDPKQGAVVGLEVAVDELSTKETIDHIESVTAKRKILMAL